jgi:hypothetical protein
MSFTFETLLDKILMIILRYSGDVYTIFRTYLGLNQRLNRILLDKRLHLFADFLHLNPRDGTCDDYTNSVVLQDVSRQLSSINTQANEPQLRQCFQSLIMFHIKEQSTRLRNEFQLNLMAFETMRQHISIEATRQVESLVLTRGTGLQCDDDELGGFNLAEAINQLLIHHFNNINSVSRQFIYRITQMFKAFIMSNTRLLKNRVVVNLLLIAIQCQ